MLTKKLLRSMMILSLCIFQSCFDYKLIDEEAFIGTWELKGREIYSGMRVHIKKEENNLKGYTICPPKNNYGEMFFEKNKIWVTEIKRSANYYFKMSEQKIATELLSQYDLKTNNTFYVTFSEDKNKIYLTTKRPNKFIQESKIYYERIR